MRISKLYSVVFLLCFINIQNICANHTKAVVKKTVESYMLNNFLNATFMFADDKNILYTGAKGLFALDGTQLTANQNMPIASATKPIVAVAVLKLQDKGLLKVQDKIIKHIDPKFWPNKIPDWASQMTIHNLLTHTSGLPEYLGAVKLSLDVAYVETNKRSIVEFLSEKPLESPIGSKFKYTNSNFVLLGMIVEHLSGKSLDQFLKDEIFTPLGMKNTNIASIFETKAMIENLGKDGYPIRYFVEPTGGKPKFSPLSSNFIVVPLGDGGVLSNLNDLIKFHRALHQGKLLSNKSYKEMIKKYYKSPETQLTKYKNTYTGYGIFITELNNKTTMIHHAGNAFGIRAETGYVPAKNLYIAILSNLMVQPPSNDENKVDMTNPVNQLDIIHFRDAVLRAVMN